MVPEGSKPKDLSPIFIVSTREGRKQMDLGGILCPWWCSGTVNNLLEEEWGSELCGVGWGASLTEHGREQPTLLDPGTLGEERRPWEEERLEEIDISSPNGSTGEKER